jgi:hypothetical protein
VCAVTRLLSGQLLPYTTASKWVGERIVGV